jgi:hypothetical protein
MNDGKEKIEVSDLGLASLLVTLHFQMVGMERVNEKRISFLFAHDEGIEKIISDFWADVEIFVPIQSLFQNQRQLKNRLYAFK